MGITGKEVLLEERRDVYELLDLKLSIGRVAVFSRVNCLRSSLRTATAYPNLAKRYFRQMGMHADVVKIQGDAEAACISGLRIVWSPSLKMRVRARQASGLKRRRSAMFPCG